MFNLQEISISNLGTVIAPFFQYQKTYHPCIILGNVVTSQKIAKFHLTHNCLQLGHFASLRTVNKGVSLFEAQWHWQCQICVHSWLNQSTLPTVYYNNILVAKRFIQSSETIASFKLQSTCHAPNLHRLKNKIFQRSILLMYLWSHIDLLTVEYVKYDLTYKVTHPKGVLSTHLAQHPSR